MRRFDWKTKSLATTIVILLFLVLNPELRAFLLVLEFLGADMVLLLLGGYVNHYWPAIVCYVRPVIGLVFSGARALGTSLRWVAYGLHPRDGQWAHMDHLGIAGGVAARIALGQLHR